MEEPRDPETKAYAVSHQTLAPSSILTWSQISQIIDYLINKTLLKTTTIQGCGRYLVRSGGEECPIAKEEHTDKTEGSRGVWVTEMSACLGGQETSHLGLSFSICKWGVG